jgi:hypothetical protein
MNFIVFRSGAAVCHEYGFSYACSQGSRKLAVTLIIHRERRPNASAEFYLQ